MLKSNAAVQDYSQATQTYTWSTANFYGKGATASVYKATHKETGDVVAVKVFHSSFASVLSEYQVLKKLKHKNIINFIGLEYETISKSKVIIMEFCAGGSVYSMLENPVYMYGFPEEEFLALFTHVAAGCEYLHDEGIIHRDIKPGNIMQYISEDYSSVYKLTDFGTARKLQTDETFMSLHGTEEYLHPDMFACAVLRDSSRCHFKATVDLWSLGATFFHVASGHLPFQPFGGRKNGKTMFEMIAKKECGVISGIQTSEGGIIKWSKELPETCLLSSGLKWWITPMLAGLMEHNQQKSWSFNLFFQFVKETKQRMVLRVFFSSASFLLKIQINRHDKFAALQEAIADHTDVPASEQLLLIQEKELVELIEPNQEIHSYPKCIITGTIFLFVKDRYETSNIPNLVIPPFPSVAKMESNKLYRAGQRYCAIIHLIKCYIEEMSIISKLLIDAEVVYREFIKRCLRKASNYVDVMSKIITEKNGKILVVRLASEMLQFRKDQKLISQLTSGQLEKAMKEIESSISEIRSKLMRNNHEMQKLERCTSNHNLGCQSDDRCASKVDYQFHEMLEIWTKLKDDYKSSGGSFTYQQDSMHRQIRYKIEILSQKVLSLFQNHCKPNLDATHLKINETLQQLSSTLNDVWAVEKLINEKSDQEQLLTTQLHLVEEVVKTAMKNRLREPEGQQTEHAAMEGMDQHGSLERSEHTSTKKLENATDICRILKRDIKKNTTIIKDHYNKMET